MGWTMERDGPFLCPAILTHSKEILLRIVCIHWTGLMEHIRLSALEYGIKNGGQNYFSDLIQVSYPFAVLAIKVDIQRYLTWIIFREIAQRVHANPSNYNSRPHRKDLCNTKREKIPSPFPFEKPTETRRTRLIFVMSLNGQS